MCCLFETHMGLKQLPSPVMWYALGSAKGRKEGRGYSTCHFPTDLAVSTEIPSLQTPLGLLRYERDLRF